MTGLDDDNREGGSESETEGKEYDDVCDDGDSSAGRSTMLTGTGSFNQNGNSMQLSDALGSRQMSLMSYSNHFEIKVQADEQEVGATTRSGEGTNHFNLLQC